MRLLRAALMLASLLIAFVMSLTASSGVAAAPRKGVQSDYTQSDDSVKVRAFIYADSTNLEMDSYSAALKIKDDSGGNIAFTRNGRYARVSGKLNHFTALIDGQPVEFTRKGWEPPKPPALIVAAAQPATPAIASEPAASATASAPAAAIASAAAAPQAQSATAADAPLVASSAAAPIIVEEVIHPPLPVWTLERGKLVGQELSRWAKSADWTVVWQLGRDIVVPADTSFEGDFQKAAEDVITTLAANGALIRVKSYEGNRTLVISGPGTVPQ